MFRILTALTLAISISGAALSQSIEEIDLKKIPSIERQLTNPKSLYPLGGVNNNIALSIEAAYYETLTDRYGHNIFATPNEHTSLVVRAGGVEHRVTLGSDVFEDTFPLIDDLDGDAKAEIITIQSSLTKGGSIAVYGVIAGVLKKISQTPNIGTRNRWMNIAGIADFNGDGDNEIAVVDRPHIRGELEFWTFTKDRKLELRTAALGFSNHFIGSSAQDLSAVVNVGKKTLLALPSTDRRNLQLVEASDNDIKIVANAELPSKIAENFATVRLDGVVYIGLLLADGSKKAFAVRP